MRDIMSIVNYVGVGYDGGGGLLWACRFSLEHQDTSVPLMILHALRLIDPVISTHFLYVSLFSSEEIAHSDDF